MGLSETIIAAAIGAAATVSTALFQLFSALRSNHKADTKPKRGSTLRSIVAVAALMLVSAVSGFLFSEFRQERTAQDMHSMREELNAKLQLLAATTERIAAAREQPAPTVAVQDVKLPIAREASLFIPACSLNAECSEAQAQTELLCDTLSDSLRVSQVELFVRAAALQTPWDQARAQFDQEMGGVKFVGGVAENAIAGQQKTVCVTVAHWSDQPHVARMVLNAVPIPDVAAPATEQSAVVNAALGAAVAPQLTNAIGEAR
jgi:hypothetical protein